MAAANADRLVGLLGKPADDPAVLSILDELRTLRRPEPNEEDAEDPYAFVPVRRAGLEFGFTDAAFFHAGPVEERGRGDYVLTHLYFYNWPRGPMARYDGSLPCGLDFADDRQTVRHKLGRLGLVPRSYERDVFELPGYTLVVSYAPGDASISDVICRLFPRPWPAPDATVVPPLETIVELFGKSPRSEAFRAAFGEMNVEERLEDLKEERSISFRDHGFELYFWWRRLLNLTGSDHGLVFSGIKLFRARENDAVGWSGPLPFRLRFDDSPDAVLATVPAEPVSSNETDQIGFFLWSFPSFDLHIYFNKVENIVLTVSMFAPGYWQTRGHPLTRNVRT